MKLPPCLLLIKRRGYTMRVCKREGVYIHTMRRREMKLPLLLIMRGGGGRWSLGKYERFKGCKLSLVA